MLGNKGIFNDPDGVTTDGTNEVGLLHESAGHQPCGFRYNLVLITFNRRDGTGLLFGPLVRWGCRESRRALVIPLAANIELEITKKYGELTSPFNAASRLLIC